MSVVRTNRDGQSHRTPTLTVRALVGRLLRICAGAMGRFPPRGVVIRCTDRELASMADEVLGRAGGASMVVIALRDLTELRDVLGLDAARAAVETLATRMCQVAGGSAVVCQTAPAMFTLLLPGLGRRQALDAVQSTLSAACCIEIEVDGERIPVFAKTRTLELTRALPFAQLHRKLCCDLLGTSQRGVPLSQGVNAPAQPQPPSQKSSAESRARAAEPGRLEPIYAPMPATIPVPLQRS